MLRKERQKGEKKALDELEKKDPEAYVEKLKKIEKDRLKVYKIEKDKLQAYKIEKDRLQAYKIEKDRGAPLVRLPFVAT